MPGGYSAGRGVWVDRWGLTDQAFEVEDLSSSQHVVDGASELGRQDGVGAGRSVFAFDACAVGFDFGGLAFDQGENLAEGPFEIGVADFFSGGSVAFSVGGMFAGDQAAVGEKVAHGRKPADVVDLVKQRHGDDPADAGDRLQEKEIVGIVNLGRLFQEQLELPDMFVVVPQEVDVDLDREPDGWIGEVFGDSGSVAGVLEFFAGGQICLVV